MLNTTTFVGLDVHARSIKAVALDAMTGEVRSATFGYDAAEVAGWVSSVDPSAKCVYESGVTGFDLQKRLSSMGIDCVVGAVSKMIKPSADRRRKNDRNDAEFLARMLPVGNVVEVRVPDDECEAARDLARALDDAREDLRRCKQRLSKFLLRHGLVFSEVNAKGQRRKNWTAAHWAWIRSISFPDKVIVAWSTSTSPDMEQQELLLDRLLERMPEGAKPVPHSDMGWQYQHEKWTRRLRKAEVTQSMSRKGNCLDNGATEQVFGHLKDEFFRGRSWPDFESFKADLDAYIVHWNTRRRQVKLNGLTPEEFRSQSRVA